MSSKYGNDFTDEQGRKRLEEVLESLELMLYLEVFIAAGFETWEKLMNITEAQLYVLLLK